MKINFTFWNIQGKSLIEEACLLCKEYNLDVLVLAEHSKIEKNVFVLRLFAHTGNEYIYSGMSGNPRVALFHKKSINVKLLLETRHSSTFILSSLTNNILLCAVHYPSLLYHERDDLDSFSHMLLEEIRRIQREEDCEDIVIFGDFNMNPFSRGMISPYYFNATLCPKVAKKRSRVVDNYERQYFYNPMWKLYGSIASQGIGTCYYETVSNSLFWNMFDQVIMSGGVVDRFVLDGLSILTKINNVDLVNGVDLVNNIGIPDSVNYSDHLPLKFVID